MFKIRSFSELLLFLSKTDLHVISFCTIETRNTQISLGGLVMITGLFAFISGYYAISSTFGVSVVAVLVAILYSSTIMAFDRELVSFTSEDKRPLWTRVPLAILIGLVISLPLELRLMDTRIDAEIKKTIEVRNKGALDEIGRIEALAEAKRYSILQEIDVLDDQLKKKAGSMEREERDRGGVGPRYRSLQAQYEHLLSKRERAKQEHAAVAVSSEESMRIKEIRSRLDAEYRRSRDLLSRFEALGKVEEDSFSALILSWTLRIFFVILELFPVIIKFFLPYNEYQAYLNARRSINIQKAHCYGNYAMDEIQKDPYGSLKRREFTDDLEDGYEDPHLQVKVPEP